MNALAAGLVVARRDDADPVLHLGLAQAGIFSTFTFFGTVRASVE